MGCEELVFGFPVDNKTLTGPDFINVEKALVDVIKNLLKTSFCQLQDLESVPVLEIGAVSRIGGGEISPIALLSADARFKCVAVDTGTDDDASVGSVPLIQGDVSEENVQRHIKEKFGTKLPKIIIGENVFTDDCPRDYLGGGSLPTSIGLRLKENFNNLSKAAHDLLDDDGCLVVFNNENEPPEIRDFEIIYAYVMKGVGASASETIFVLRKKPSLPSHDCEVEPVAQEVSTVIGV